MLGIQYQTVKYKNHFYEFDENFRSHHNSAQKIYLDKEFVEQSKSKIWDWNQRFWEHLDDFMLAQNKSYHKSIGGSADSNQNLAKYSAHKFYEKCKSMDKINTGQNLKINYLEMGAAGTEWAKMFLQELENLGGISNLTYIFTDFSQKALSLAKNELGEKYGNVKVEYIYLGEGNTKEFFNKYKNKISQIHATNIYDNFPMNRILFQNGKIYAVKVRAYVPSDNVEVFTNYWKDYLEWQKLWDALKFEEKFEEITFLNNPNLFNFYQKLNPENIELEMNVSNEVNKNISKNLELLQAGGVLEIIDIIAVNLEKYKEFLGPVKYDGSIANYVNLPEILQYLKDKNINFSYEISSLEKFGGRKNQSILEIVKLDRNR